MKIAFITIYDTRLINRGSGTWYHMGRAMEAQGHELCYIGSLENIPVPLITRILQALHRKINKRYLSFLDPFLGMRRGREATRRLKRLTYDIILTNDYSISAYTKVDKPIVLYTESIIMFDYGLEKQLSRSRISNLSSLGLFLYRHVIKKGLRLADICVFPLAFSAKEALNYYNDNSKIAIVEFGANIDYAGPETALNRKFSKITDNGRIDILFIGGDWVHKGGDIAIAAVNELRKRKINAFLHIVGLKNPMPTEEDHIKYYGYLNKAAASETHTLLGLYKSCDLLILPSQREGFGIVILEAAAYGLPVIAYDAMGINEIVKNGETGFLMDLDQTEMGFANAIQALFVNPGLYDRMALNTRRHYENHGTWDKSVKKLINEINIYLKAKAQ